MQLKLPRGTPTAESYLFSTSNDRYNFEAKDDGIWRCYPVFSRQACQGCAVFVPINTANPPAALYLGLKNPSS